MSPLETPNLDRILETIRTEAARRGAANAPGFVARKDAPGSPVSRRPALRDAPKHVRDYLTISSESLLETAYRRLLNRPPDPTGLENFRRLLRSADRTKIEVLGLLRYSGEGRQQDVDVPGLPLAFALALAYRIPMLGWALSFLGDLLGLPPHLRDRRRIEAVAQAAAVESDL